MKVLARALLVVIMLVSVPAVVTCLHEGDVAYASRWLGILALSLVFWVIIELLARIAEAMETNNDYLRVLLSKKQE